MSHKDSKDETPTVDWSGASGRIYRYWVYSLPMTFEPGSIGNYIFARFEGGRWIALEIGEGDICQALQTHRPERRRVTHLHANQGGLHQVRRDEARDLLKQHPQARSAIEWSFRI